jgi:putative ABC transport system permease protein
LATLGIYGLIANAVVERTSEFGIRMALGCTMAQAVRAVSIPGISLTLTGLIIGCILALGATRILRTLIWGVEPTDILTFGTVCAAMLVVAALASLVPALRLARISPAQTLREE